MLKFKNVSINQVKNKKGGRSRKLLRCIVGVAQYLVIEQVTVNYMLNLN